MNIKIIGIILIFSLGMFSCTEEFDFQYKNNEERIVVDGLITNQPGPYYVHLSEAITRIISTNYSGVLKKVGKPIKDAVVSISDNQGNQEVLKFVGKRRGSYDESEGWYATENLRGVIGRVYTLTIKWNKKRYTAVDTLKAVPSIDKVDFRTKHLEAKNENVTVPLITFNEPQNEKNYYLVHFSIDGFLGSSRSWSYSIFDDEYLEKDVNNLEIDDGQSPSGRDFYQEIQDGQTVVVYLESLSEVSYRFYQNVISQFANDGGSFSPNPSSPPTNISDGGLGLFRASAVSLKTKVK